VLTETQRQIQTLARDFAAEHLAPHSARWDAEGAFPRDVVARLGELGFMGMLVPEEYEGLGLDTLTYLVALEEIAAADAAVAVTLSIHNSIAAGMILAFGSDAQKARWLKGMAKGAVLGAFALSEADAGSDAASLRAQARRVGTEWVLSGTKAWVTNGGKADVVVALVRTDTPEQRRGVHGISAFLVPTATPGYRPGKPEDKLGLRASDTRAVTFEDLRLPGDALLGEEGKGFAHAMQGLDRGRLGVAAQAVGIARRALEHTVAYCAERRQFERPLREFQGVQFKLADMAVRVEAARALLWHAALRRDAGDRGTMYGSMAKLFASEAAMWVTTQAIQLFGGYGYMRDYPVEKLFRDAKVTEIYEGTSEIQRIVVSRELYAGR